MKKLALIAFFSLIVGGSLALGGGLGYFAGLVEEMEVPTEESLIGIISNVEEVSSMTYNDDTEISEIRADLIRTNTTLARINPHIINGLVATEDENFFDHVGVVPSAVMRAMVSTFLGVGETSGGSTISQQLVKQRLLTNEVSFERKAKEILLALRLENFFTKEQILQAYLNVSPYGRNNKGENIAGIEEAAQGVFGVSASEVTLPQAAYLVGMPQNPYTYTPYQQTGALKSQDGLQYGVDRMHEVLDRMLLTNYISAEEHEAASNYDIRQDLIASEEAVVDAARSTYLYQAIEREATEVLMAKQVEIDGLSMADVNADVDLYNEYYALADTQLRNGGFVVKSTIDQAVYDSMNTTATYYADALGSTYYTEQTDPETGEITTVAEPVQTGQVLMENATGKILGFVAGRDFEVSQVDHAFSTRRSPGSTIKPLLVYAPAIQERIIGPSSMLADTYMRIVQGDGTVYEPSNYGSTISNKFVTARYSLAMSMNNPTLYLYNELLAQGVDVQKYMYNLGWDQAITEDEFQNIALSLGGTNTGPTVEELTSAFATFANQGQHRDAYLIESITDSNGTVVYQHQAEVTQVFSPDVAYVMVDMLRSVLTEGTWANYQGRISADADWYVKTGTSEDNRDLWVAASSPKVTLTSWIGYDGSNVSRTLDDPGESAAYGMPGRRQTEFWLNQANSLHQEFPELLGQGLTHERPDGVQDLTVVPDTGTTPGDFTGPYDLNYRIPSSAATKVELFPSDYTVPAANFKFAIGAKLDETVDALEKYRIKSDSAANQQAAKIRSDYLLRKDENEKARLRIFQENEVN